MFTKSLPAFACLFALALTGVASFPEQKEPPPVDFLADQLAAWKMPHGGWLEVGSVEIDPKNPKRFVATEGKGVWFNGPKGNAKNLFSKHKFADVQIILEFNIPKGSNSGIKFHSHYEVQILDSFGRKDLTGDDCGGIYPRADVIKGRYTHLDKGIAPKVNACKKPGEWQTLDVIFLAPRFDKEGKKIKNAMIQRALLNGQMIHENLELLTPTGDRWKNAEMFEGALMLQADHGPVAIRKMVGRPIR